MCAYDRVPLQSSGRGSVCEDLLEHLLKTWKIMKRETCAVLIHQSLPSLNPPAYRRFEGGDSHEKADECYSIQKIHTTALC